MLFDKKRRLQECVDYMNQLDTNDKYIELKKACCSENWLENFITISDITPRQTGTTTAISELFDVDNDVYYTHNRGCCMEFSNKLITLGKLEHNKDSRFKYMYTTTHPSKEEKVICELARMMDIKITEKFKFEIPARVRGRINTGILWVDLGSWGMHVERNVIYDAINKFYSIYPRMKFIIC